MRFTRFLTLGALIAMMGWASPTLAQHSGQNKLDSIAFVREFPLALVYEGIARFRSNDFQGAIDVWEEYLQRAGKGADTASVNWMVHEALIHAYPAALVYEGLALAKGGDPDGAIRAWERYQDLGIDGSDTASVRKMTEQLFFETYPLARFYQGVLFYLSYEYERAAEAWELYLANGASRKERSHVRELIAMARKHSDARDVARAGGQ